MLTYVTVVFIFSIFLCLVDVSIPKNAHKLFLFSIVCGLLWFAASFRYGDLDYNNYYKSYRYLQGNFEIGYAYLEFLFNKMQASLTTFFSFIALLSVAFMGRFIYKYNTYAIVGLLIYLSHVFVLREMLQIRAGLAIAICMFAIPHIAKRSFMKFLLITLIASLFHFVALFWIIVYVLYPILQIRKYLYLFLSFGFLLGILLNDALFKFLLDLLKLRVIYVYLVDKTYNYSLGLFNPVLIKQLLVLFLILWNKEYLEKKVPYLNVFIVSYTIACFWLSAFNFFAIFAARIATLFANVEHVLIPALLFLRYKLLILLFIILYCLVAFSSKISLLKDIDFVF